MPSLRAESDQGSLTGPETPNNNSVQPQPQSGWHVWAMPLVAPFTNLKSNGNFYFESFHGQNLLF